MGHVHSPCKWIGGKFASAERIVAMFPDASRYDTYVETCGGAAHVLMAKPPCGHKEIYNDLDNNLVTFWMEMREHADDLQERLQSLPYARSLYYPYYRSLFDGTDLSSFERAVRWFYVLRSTGTGWMRRSPVGWNHPTGASFRNALETFQDVQKRMHRVAIDNRDVLATIRRYDSPRTLFYVDPPYVGVEYYYEVSKKGFPHETLATLLQSIQGYASVSYYPHPSLDAFYPEEKWHRLTWQQTKSSDIASETRAVATELLLTNYAPATMPSLWEIA